jgi:DNA-binding transcriptional LysR family regulator
MIPSVARRSPNVGEHAAVSGDPFPRVQPGCTLPDAPGDTLFTASGQGPYFEMVRDFFRGDGVPGPRLEPTGSVEAVKHSVASYPEGLGMLAAFSVTEELRARRFRVLPVQPEATRMRLKAMLYRTRAPVHPAVGALLELLRASLGT